MKIDGDLSEILGIHIGDGCISRTKRYAEYYLGGDITEERDYHYQWVGPLFNKKIMLPLFNKKVTYKAHPKVGIYGFHIFDEKLVKFFEKLGIKSGSKINVQVPKEIMQNKLIHKRFLRGLFDTDGTIYFNRNIALKNYTHNRPVIKLGTVSELLAKDVIVMLGALGMHPRMKKPYQGKRDKNPVYSVVIYRIADIRYFMSEIGFKNFKHSTKWQLYEKFGFCPPRTKLQQRRELLSKTNIFNSSLQERITRG